MLIDDNFTTKPRKVVRYVDSWLATITSNRLSRSKKSRFFSLSVFFEIPVETFNFLLESFEVFLLLDFLDNLPVPCWQFAHLGFNGSAVFWA